MEYVIEFTYEGATPADNSILYAGWTNDGALGFAPTVRTAIQTDREAAERILVNGYGNLSEIGRVVALSEVETK